MKFTFQYKGKTCKGHISIIEDNDLDEYEVEYNNDKTIIFLSGDDLTEDVENIWFQKAAPGEKLWPTDLIEAIGKEVAFINFYPDSFIVAFKENGQEYSAEVLKNGEGYKIISYLLPDKSLNRKSYTIYQSTNAKDKEWKLEEYVGPTPLWVSKLGKAIEKTYR